MPKQIVAVRLKDGEKHEHIAGVVYIEPDTRPLNTGSATMAGLLKMLADGEKFFVVDFKGDTAEVIPVRSEAGAKYVRTRKDGVLTDNLLKLPRYTLS